MEIYQSKFQCCCGYLIQEKKRKKNIKMCLHEALKYFSREMG